MTMAILTFVDALGRLTIDCRMTAMLAASMQFGMSQALNVRLNEPSNNPLNGGIE